MNNLIYILMVVAGAALYGTISSFIKLAYEEGYTSAEVAFWQAFLSALVLSALCHRNISRLTAISARNIFSLLVTGAMIGLTNLTYYTSVQYISASLAVILLMQFTWMSLLIESFLGRKSPRAEWYTMVVILFGTLLASGFLESDLLKISMKGVFYACLSALTYALYIVLNGRISQKSTWQVKSAMIMIGSSICIFLFNAPHLASDSYLCADFFFRALFLAIAGTAVPTVLFSIGIPRIGAVLSSALMTVELPVAVLTACIVLNESLTRLQIVGVLIFLAAVIDLNILRNSR